jgi:hypothetical protein
MGELPSHPLAAPFASRFDAFQQTWFTTFTARAALQIAVGKAEGAIVGADNNLDDFIDILDRTLLILTKNDRAAALYRFYFGLQTPSEQKRPILADELTTVKGWVASLQASPHPPLAALAAALIGLIAAADAAVKTHQDAVQALKDFDLLGGKKELIDAFNVLRQTVYGELAAMPHAHPDAMLPATFADRFFRHAINKGITGIKSPDIVQARITSLQSKVTAAQSHLASLQAEAQAREAAEALTEKDALALEQAKANEVSARQARKALEKQLKADARKIKKA